MSYEENMRNTSKSPDMNLYTRVKKRAAYSKPKTKGTNRTAVI